MQNIRTSKSRQWRTHFCEKIGFGRCALIAHCTHCTNRNDTSQNWNFVADFPNIELIYWILYSVTSHCFRFANFILYIHIYIYTCVVFVCAPFSSDKLHQPLSISNEISVTALKLLCISEHIKQQQNLTPTKSNGFICLFSKRKSE